MAFTTPRTWSTGELVDATTMNTHVRDNLVFLKADPVIASTTTSSNHQNNWGGEVTILTLSGVAIPADVGHCYVEAWAASWGILDGTDGHNTAGVLLREATAGLLHHVQTYGWYDGNTIQMPYYARSPDYAWAGTTRTVTLSSYASGPLMSVAATASVSGMDTIGTTPITLRIVRSH